MKSQPTATFGVTSEQPAQSTKSISATADERTIGRDVRPEPDSEDPPAQVSRFVIRKRLGRGGFGSVYLAYDPVLDREIALKVPRGPGDWADEQMQSFLAEARIAVRLKHPHVIAVYDAGEASQGGVFIAMEYVDGEPLSERLKRGKLSVADARRICGQIAQAIHEGHKLGLIHRDLKPANILLDNKGDVKVCDFGLAMHEDGAQARGDEISGTLPYMSPEQLAGNNCLLDGRSDIWSLGVILYECLSGRRPFRGETWEEMSEAIRSREPKPLRQLDETLPPALDELCQHCLRKSLSERLPTAFDFQQRIAQARDRSSGKGIRWVLAVGLAAMLCGAVAFAASHLLPFGFRQDEIGKGNVDVTRSPNELPSLHPEVLTGTTDLLRERPREVVFENLDPQSIYAYSARPGKLAVHSIYWAAFACGKHPADFGLDVATLHGGEPAHVGVFWGLHPESEAEGRAQESCLCIVVRPAPAAPAEASLSCYRLTIADGIQGRRNFAATHELFSAAVGVDWSKPVDIQLQASAGRCTAISVQGKPLKVPGLETMVEWKEFSTGECGLISPHSKDQVVFTRALLQSH